MPPQIHTLFRPIQANGRVTSHRYREVAPSPQLAPYVSCYWLSEPELEYSKQEVAKSLETLDKEGVDRVLPDGCSDIIFEQDLYDHKCKAWISGEEYLISCLRFETIAAGNVSIINNLLYLIFMSGGKMSVKEMADREVISVRQMNRLFYRWIGTSPKRFCEVVRFQSVMRSIQRLRIVGPDIAYQHGFFDQGHMIRDFKRFYGDSPSVAAREFGNVRFLQSTGCTNLLK